MTDVAESVARLREHLGRDVPLAIMRADDLNEIATELRDLRGQLRDAHNDLLNIRGILSPNGQPRRVPPAVQMVPNAAPAVQWLADDRDMYRDRWNAARGDAEEWRQHALKHRDEGSPFEQAAWRAMAHALCCVLSALDGDEAGKPADAETIALAPPPGSYWTDLDGKVWDLSCQYLDRHHRLWRVVGMVEGGPALTCIQMPGMVFALAHVAAAYGLLTPIPPKVELSHYGNGTHGGPAKHIGGRENCPAPECMDAEADEREERDEETRRVRILLNAVNRFIERWAEAGGQARAHLWRDLSIAADPVSELFDARIADLDHRAALLPDGGLATKPARFDLSALIEPAPSTPAPHRVKVHTVHVINMTDDQDHYDEPRYDVQHTPQCDALPYGESCWFDQQETDVGTDDWPTEPGEYIVNGEYTEYDFYVDFAPAPAADKPCHCYPRCAAEG